MMNLNFYMMIYILNILILFFLIFTILLPLMYENIHSLYLMMFLILLTTLTTIFMNLNMKNSIIPYIIFLTMISGMMIIFLYFSSLINNMNYKIKFKWIKFLMIFIPFTFTILMMNFSDKNMNLMFMNSTINNNNHIYSLYFNSYSILTFILMIHLFISMLFATKISTKKFLSLRKFK